MHALRTLFIHRVWMLSTEHGHGAFHSLAISAIMHHRFGVKLETSISETGNLVRITTILCNANEGE